LIPWVSWPKAEGNPLCARLTEAQIVEDHAAGATFVELSRRHGVHPNTICASKAKYGGMESSEIARNRATEDENSRMRRIITNLTLENDAMRQLIEKTPGALIAKRSGEGVTRTRTKSARRMPDHRLSSIGRSV
jgi:putative transposase